MALEIHDRATFYLKSAIHRALYGETESIRVMESVIQEQTEAGKENGSIALEMQGLIGYRKQWLQEALHEFAKLPDDLKPNNLDFYIERWGWHGDR